MKLRTLFYVGMVGLAAYAISMPKLIPAVNGALMERSLRIPRNHEDLERALSEERKIVGIDENLPLHIRFVPYLTFSVSTAARTFPEAGGYRIEIDPRFGNTHYALRHELCHIKKDRLPGHSLSYIYFYEPRAILCSLPQGGWQ